MELMQAVRLILAFGKASRFNAGPAMLNEMDTIATNNIMVKDIIEIFV